MFIHSTKSKTVSPLFTRKAERSLISITISPFHHSLVERILSSLYKKGREKSTNDLKSGNKEFPANLGGHAASSKPVQHN